MEIKIGLVDDHHLIRKGIRSLLGNLNNYEVVLEASNGKEMIQQLETAEMLPEIILIDVNMPVMGGVEAVKIVTDKFPDIKMIALSVSDDVKTIKEMIGAGAKAYLFKDSSPELFLNVLVQVKENGFFYDKVVIESLMLANKPPSWENKKKDNYKSQLQVQELTLREIEFIQYCCSELTYKEIAEKMKLSYRTIDGHREAVFTKLEVKSRTGLVIFAIYLGLVKL